MTNKQTIWEYKQLSSLGSFSKGVGISKADIVPQGAPCIRYAEIYTKYNFQLSQCLSHIPTEIAQKSTPIAYGNILFAGSGETAEDIGKSVAYLGKDTAYASGDIIIFTLKDKKENALFFSYYLNTAGRQQLNKLGEGQSIVHIYPEELSKVFVPHPLVEEQHRIVEVLETWDKAIQLTRKLIEQKELQKKYLMQQLLTGRTRLNGCTDCWTEEPFRKLINIYQGYPFKSSSYVKNGTYRIITIANVQQGQLDTTKCNYINELPKNLQTYQRLQIGDLIFSMTGNVGRSCWVSRDNCLLNQRVGKIQTKKINKQFLYHFLQNPKFIYDMIVCAQGGAQANLSVKDILKYYIYFPSDITEQESIAKILSLNDKEIDLLHQKLAKLEEQKRGLMQVLLTGKIRLAVKENK